MYGTSFPLKGLSNEGTFLLGQDQCSNYSKLDDNYSNNNNNNNSNNNNNNSKQTSAIQTTSDCDKPQQLIRHLNVWDLLGIGIGSTVGSGVFVLVGTIASEYSCRSCWISMLIGGVAATCSGICFIELSSKIPYSGSTYVYTKMCFGDYAAVIAAACITLEYGISGAAVARTWGDKVLVWIQPMFLSNDNIMQLDNMNSIQQNYNENESFDWMSSLSPWFIPNNVINIPAFFVSATATAILLSGISTSKAITNWITLFKMIVVLIMIVAGFCLYESDNIPQHVSWASKTGVSNIFRGATVSFFGYLGYDEVCCVAGEAIHPARDIPRAVLGTLFVTTMCYVLAAIALTGMLPCDEISPVGGFPNAFQQRDVIWLANFTAIGEFITLPIVSVLCLLAQPRLMYSMAIDGILPKCFCRMDANGNLTAGTLFAGIVMTFIATVVPFTYLNDVISAGILVAFNMTNSCLVLFRCKPKSRSSQNNLSTTQQQQPSSIILYQFLALYNGLCFLSALLWNHDNIVQNVTYQNGLAISTSVLTLLCFVGMTRMCPPSKEFGGVILVDQQQTNALNDQFQAPISLSSSFDSKQCHQHLDGCVNENYFTAPAVPFIPCAGIAINWYLIAQLESFEVTFLCLYLSLALIVFSLSRRLCTNNARGEQL
jgi:basic amino acid/polyamine antiporter, APA family